MQTVIYCRLSSLSFSPLLCSLSVSSLGGRWQVSSRQEQQPLTSSNVFYIQRTYRRATVELHSGYFSGLCQKNSLYRRRLVSVATVCTTAHRQCIELQRFWIQVGALPSDPLLYKSGVLSVALMDLLPPECLSDLFRQIRSVSAVIGWLLVEATNRPISLHVFCSLLSPATLRGPAVWEVNLCFIVEVETQHALLILLVLSSLCILSMQLKTNSVSRCETLEMYKLLTINLSLINLRCHFFWKA